MTRHFPRLTLALLLLAAGAALAAGLWMARRVEVVRVERDRDPLKKFAAHFQVEVTRLEALYERHVRTLAVEGSVGDSFAIQAQAGRVVGVRQISVVAGAGSQSHHIKIGLEPGDLPSPTLTSGRTAFLGKEVVLPIEYIGTETGAGGWFLPPGDWRYYWHRRETGPLVVVLVDSEAVRAAMRGALEAWIPDALRPVRALGGPDAVTEAGGKNLVKVGDVPLRFPDLVLPVRSAFGDWEVVSWQTEMTVVRWSRPVLAGASAFSAALAWLGVAGFFWQRRLQQLAAQRVSFVNRVSHELRTPLTNIVLNADLAAEALEGAPEQAGRRLAVVREEAGRLTRLIDNVLTFSQRGSRRPAAATSLVRPADVVAAMVQTFEPAFARRGVSVRVTGDAPPAPVDPDLLTQVLANLLSNAEKYAPGGEVGVSMRRQAANLVVQVRDDGPGIAPGDAEKIFEPFVRLDDRLTEGVAGAGLGLSIARDAAARLGGSLRVVPNGNIDATRRGTAFELLIPAYAAEGAPAVSKAVAADGSAQPIPWPGLDAPAPR